MADKTPRWCRKCHGLTTQTSGKCDNEEFRQRFVEWMKKTEQVRPFDKTIGVGDWRHKEING